MQSAGKRHHAPDVSTVSEEENFLSMGEPPQGDTPPTFTAETEEMQTAALGLNSIATEFFLGCLWEICISLRFVLVQQGCLRLLPSLVLGRWPSIIQLPEHAIFQFAFLI